MVRKIWRGVLNRAGGVSEGGCQSVPLLPIVLLGRLTCAASDPILRLQLCVRCARRRWREGAARAAPPRARERC